MAAAAWQRHEQQQGRSLGGSSGARTAARQRDQRDSILSSFGERRAADSSLTSGVNSSRSQQRLQQ
ncbi:hypothetical protein Dimus_005449, partial [Dionaea muscipula]